MEECLSSEHSSELLTNSLEHFLDGGGVTKEEEFLFCTLSICSSTSLVDILPLNIAEAVRYLPCLGTEAHIMFLVSNICWVSSGTVRALYCWEPLEVSGANPVMKKWSLGNGMR